MGRPFVLGLTGSIGMGKSVTASMFAELGASIWDADEAVNRIYASGQATKAIQNLTTEAVGHPSGAVNKDLLKTCIDQQPELLSLVEAIVHPMVHQDRKRFLREAAEKKAPLAVVVVPLLYETSAEKQCDAVAVVSSSKEFQKQRVMERDGMTEERFARFLELQLPDEEKRLRADYVVCSQSLDQAWRDVRGIMSDIERKSA